MKVLVVGAGIGGLALVHALGDLDLSVDLVERAASNAVGVGIVIHPNGMRVLRKLGLAEEVRTKGNVVNQLELVRGDATLRVQLAEVWHGADQPTIAILRTDLHAILTRHALTARTAAIRTRMGCAVVRVESVDDKPLATFSDGTSAHYDLIVGADGVHSPLRQSLHVDAAPVHTGLFYWRFVAENATDLPANTWRTFEREEGSFGFIPIGGGRVHCFVQDRTGQLPCRAGDEENYLQTIFGTWHPELGAMIAARSGPLHVGAAMMVRPVRWGRGRCALLGDAAHAVAPTLSEGGSLALEDALVLAHALGNAVGTVAALEAYRTARDEPVAWALRMAVAQINAVRRRRPQRQMDPGVATQHMQRMYAPLLRATVPYTDLAAISDARSDDPN
jgi:2-polyprenyl-6-methoxyphenol hydroxylase-like FAD-dependent oxidoreductase